MSYQYEGIGRAGALLLFSALSASPAVFLTTGFLGKLTFFFLDKFCVWAAGKGVVILNIAAADLQVISEQKDYDGTFAEVLKEINGNPNRLTPEERAVLDGKVIAAFRRFASFGGLHDDKSP